MENSKSLPQLAGKGNNKLIALHQTQLAWSTFVTFFVLGTVAFLWVSGYHLVGVGMLSLLLFLLWYSVGAHIQSLATISLLKQYHRPDYLGLELSIRKLKQLLTVLPVKKEPYLMLLNYYISYCQQYQGKYEESLSVYALIDEKRISRGYFRYPYYAVKLSNEALSNLLTGEPETAESLVDKSISVCEEKEEKHRQALIYPITVKVECLLEREDYDRARKLSQEALKRINDIKKPPLWMLPLSLDQYKLSNLANLAFISIKKGELEKVELQIMQIESIYNQNKELISPFHFRPLIRLCDSLVEIERTDLAQNLLEMIYAKARAVPFHPDIPRMLDLFENVLQISGKSDQVENMRAWLLTVGE